MEITITTGGMDWPAWIQAFGSLIAIAVTAAQWGISTSGRRREQDQRARATQVLMIGVYDGLVMQIKSLRLHFKDGGPDAASAYAKAIIESLPVMEKVVSTIDMAVVPPDSLDGVMSFIAAFESIKQNLGEVALGPKDRVERTISHLEYMARQFKKALLLTRPKIPADSLMD